MEQNKEALENKQDKQKLDEGELNEVSGGCGYYIGDLKFHDNETLYLHSTERYFFSKCIHAGDITVCNSLNCESHGTPLCVRGYHYTDKNLTPRGKKIYKEEGDGVTRYIEGVR